MNGLTLKTLTFKVNVEAGIEELMDEVAVEAPVRIYLNEGLYATLMASPSQLKELAVGFLLGESVIKSLNEIKQVSVKDGMVKVKLNRNKKLKRPLSKGIILTACTSGEDFFDRLMELGEEPVESRYSIEAREILRMVRECVKKAETSKATGGTHFAGIFEDGTIKAFSEDVGRHNAIDKVIGLAALRGVDFQRSVLVSSGRQPGGMVLKAAKVKIPILASMRAPLASGVRVAQAFGLTLIGFARGGRRNVYSFPERVKV
ncbi:TPA: formate dehydrogenase accessory sulfurtransferase FdhD [Candidatus Bathyarchaeota archaeon]|nr:formate dehydrogenase accessory sulfurtransferase FdhD [Candidatus Bathyarchaeota archaeon]